MTATKQGVIPALGSKFMGATLSVQLPHLAAVILAGLAGALQALDQSTLALPARWHAYLGLGLVIAAHFAIRPLVGDAFREAFPLPNWLCQLITVIVAVGTVAAGVLPVGSLALTILSGLLTVLVALGFGPGTSAPAPAATPAK